MSELDAPQGRNLYRSGPWLLINGLGVQSEATIAAVAEQCVAREVEWESHAVDDVAALDLAYFTALVVSLPDGPGDVSLDVALEPFCKLIDCYRARRPHPLRDAVLGRRRWYQVGGVHLIGYGALLNSPQLRRTRDRSCATYRLDDDTDIDVFAGYTRVTQHARQTVEGGTVLVGLAAEARRAAVLRLLDWGLTREDAAPVLKRLELCRQDYEDPHRPAMYRPLPGVPQNRLDIILDGPDPVFSRPGHAKAWQENSARVWRDVERKLADVAPEFHYPRAGRRGAVRALRSLYVDLRIADAG